MANNPMDTSLFDRAVVFAVKAHSGTERRGKGFPYIIHPMEAVAIVATISSDQSLLAAAILHDTIEDTSVTLDDIRREFGDRVAAIVKAESDVRFSGESEEDSWNRRKKETLVRLAEAPLEAKIVALGDKLSNMRTIARDYAVKGDSLWKQFHVKERFQHEWYYRGLAESLKDLDGTLAYKEFVKLIEEVFG